MKDQKEIEKLAESRGYSLDYLTCGSPIFQIKNLYTFTSDSIQLAHFVKEKEIDCLVDLCSGSGVVGLEVVGTKNVKNAVLVELQPDLAECAKCSSELNNNETKIEVVNDDVNNFRKKFPNGMADVVTCNPPYFKAGSGDTPLNLSRAMARHEIKITLKEIIESSHYLLKEGGILYLVHIKSRQKEIEKLLLDFGFNITNEEILSGKLERILIRAEKKRTK